MTDSSQCVCGEGMGETLSQAPPHGSMDAPVENVHCQKAVVSSLSIQCLISGKQRSLEL